MERNVSVPTTIAEIVRAVGYKDEDNKNIVVSPITYRKLGRVKIVGVVQRKYPHEPDHVYRRIKLWDGYRINAVTFVPIVMETIDKDIHEGDIVEVVARTGISEMPQGGKRIDLFIESIAKTTPEAFVLHKAIVLQAIREKFSVEDPDDLLKMVETIKKLRQKYAGKKLVVYIKKKFKDKANIYKEIADVLETLDYIKTLEEMDINPEDEAEIEEEDGTEMEDLE